MYVTATESIHAARQIASGHLGGQQEQDSSELVRPSFPMLIDTIDLGIQTIAAHGQDLENLREVFGTSFPLPQP